MSDVLDLDECADNTEDQVFDALKDSANFHIYQDDTGQFKVKLKVSAMYSHL